MEITYSPTLLSFLKYKHLLLDTNIFRDASVKPTVFRTFFNDLKKSDITLSTIDLVKYELLKGSKNETKYVASEKHINSIIDVTVPILPKTLELVYELIRIYGIDGTALNMTDLLLGASLMQYKKNLCLMTRDTTDFMQHIFDLLFIVNITHQKGVFTYGIYQYSK